MAKSKGKVAPVYWIMGTLVAVLSLGTLLVWMGQHGQSSTIDSDSCPLGKVCLSQDEYSKLKDAPAQTVIVHHPPNMDIRQLPVQSSTTRDRRVLDDPLYPPLNRTDAVTHDAVNVRVQNRNMYVPTNDLGDSYRLVGYLVSNDEEQDKGGNSWKLFARQKDRHSSDFYMVPANKNYDIKISIKDDMVQGTRLRDLYSIPNEISFNSPLLNKGPYEFIENPKTDYSSSQYT